ncbi:hypothetical protein BH10ACT9_BH10ACT9_22920 [soil metagenome]
MADQAGGSASALATTQHALSARRSATAAADQALSATLADAHQLTVEALRKLDAIEAEIESAVAQQHLLALDTPQGVRDFQRFLLAKHRDITSVVTDAVTAADAKVVDVQRLLGSYRAGSGAAAEG